MTKIDLNALQRDMTQQQTDATYVMVHKLDSSTQRHTVYIKALGVYMQGNQIFEVAEVINSVPGGETLIMLNIPDNQFFKIKCVFN